MTLLSSERAVVGMIPGFTDVPPRAILTPAYPESVSRVLPATRATKFTPGESSFSTPTAMSPLLLAQSEACIRASAI